MARAPSAARLFNQLELEEVEAAATKDELERSAPLLTDFEAWLRAECARLSRSSNLIKPINYLLNRWDGFARFVYDGRICLTNLLGLDEGVVKRQNEFAPFNANPAGPKLPTSPTVQPVGIRFSEASAFPPRRRP